MTSSTRRTCISAAIMRPWETTRVRLLLNETKAKCRSRFAQFSSLHLLLPVSSATVFSCRHHIDSSAMQTPFWLREHAWINIGLPRESEKMESGHRTFRTMRKEKRSTAIRGVEKADKDGFARIQWPCEGTDILYLYCWCGVLLTSLHSSLVLDNKQTKNKIKIKITRKQIEAVIPLLY
jgi:hypothetical protein